jgi:hypothetical protein
MIELTGPNSNVLAVELAASNTGSLLKRPKFARPMAKERQSSGNPATAVTARDKHAGKDACKVGKNGNARWAFNS